MGSYLNMLSARRLGSRSSDELLSSIQNQNQSQTAVESSAPVSTKASKVQTLPTVGKTAGGERASAQLQAERSLPVLQATTSAAAQRGASLPLVRSGGNEPTSVLEQSMQVLPGIRQAVNTYTQSGTGRSRLLEERVTNTKRTIQRLEDQLAAARAQEQAREADPSVAYVTPQTGGTAAVERQLSDLRAALPIYRQEAYDALAQRADFSSRSSGLTAAEIAEQVHQDQGGTLGAVARGLSPALNFGSEPSKSPAAYTLLTEEETANYNYLRNTQGEEAARAYLDFLEERVNQREGERSAQRVREEENPILRTLNTAGTAAQAGLDQFSTGLRQIGRTEALATSPEQFASAAVREDLAETGPKIGGNSLGQIGYDAVSTLANMAPSLAAGTLNPVAGAALMSASSGGNAYGEALKENFTPEQAARYGTLTAAAEGALSYLLGGISALGGKATGHIAQRTIQSIDNALARAAVELGVHMAGEGTEEYLQEILTPVFRNLALDENNEFKPVTEEALYAGLLGALTAGLLEGGPALSSAVGEITENWRNRRGRTAAPTDAGRMDNGQLTMDSGSAAETQAVLLPTARPEAVTLPVAGRESGDVSQPPAQQNAPDTARTGQESAVPAGETVDRDVPNRYDGVRADDQTGGTTDGRREETPSALRGIYGADVRSESQRTNSRGENPYPQADRTVSRAEHAASWAKGHIVEQPSAPAELAVTQASRYIPDVFTVEDAVIKARSPRAWALTSDGTIYISNSVPEELADIVGYHEVVHAVRQRGDQTYQAFLDQVGGMLDNQSEATDRLLGVVLRSRFKGKQILDLSLSELMTAHDELNAVIWGYYKADPENARAQFAGAFRDYDGYIQALDAILERGRSGGAEPTGPESSVGAARAGFDPYTRMVNEYGAIPEGENPARVVDVPRSTDGSDRVSRTARTVMEAAATPEGALGDVGQAVTEGRLSYLPIGNQETAQQARAAIEEKGFETALRDWTAQVRSGRSSAALTAQGAQLYNAAVNAGDTRLALDILTDYAANVREAAQAVQAARILKTLTPDGQLYLVQRSVQNLQEELNRRYGDGTHTLTIDEGLAEAYRNAKTEEAREQALTDIYRQVAAQVPATWRDKWNAWRYLAMLFNLRTHGRNIGGNVAFMPVRMMKDAIATVGEQAVDVLSPRGIQRTKAPLNLASQSDRALLRAAWQDAGTMQDQILGAGKYRDSAQSQIDQYRTIFRLAPLEGLRRANSRALDVEDTWFSRPAYAGALAGYLKANGATLETAGTELLDRARAYAVREAQRATYRDSNAFSDFISSLGYRGDNRVGQAFNTLMEGVLPFRRTPANILVRGVEYSPLGLAKSLTYDLAQVRAGKQTAAEAIDHIAAGLTGTGLTALGAFLASLGLVSGGSGDDEEDQLDELTGGQPYALTIGDKNYTLDWLAPEALPFFVGVELYNAWGEEGSGRTMDDLYTALGSISEPMLEMSMLQSLQDVIDSVSYSDNKLMGLLASAATNYLTQAFPTLFGQIERVTEGERQSTYIDRTSPLSNDLQYTLGQVANKLPGEFQQMPYFDAWGRTESSGGVGQRMVNNFLAPWYTSTENETAADREIRRLLEAGETGVVPQRPSQSDQVEGEYLSRESFATYAQTMGQTSYELVSDLIGAPEYRTLSDGEKADAIALAYDYARAVGKEAVSDYQPEGWIAKAQDSGVDPADYILYRVGADAYDADGSGGLSIGERAQAMEQAGFTQEEQTLLWLMEYPDWAEAADKAGVSDSVYVAYKTATYGLTADKDAEGNSISGSKKTKVLAAIDALDIPAEEKDKLYFAAGYGASSLNEAPWR